MSDETVEFAWHIHAALREWTARVDAKASFALTLESAAIGGVIAMSGSDGRLADIDGLGMWLFRVGLAGLILAVVLSALVVTPQVRGRGTRDEWRHNHVFFGHLRHWEPDVLARAMNKADWLPMLARQHVIMSKIAWRKHRWLQLSLVFGIFGTALIATGGVLG